jgi:hypothetical protein
VSLEQTSIDLSGNLYESPMDRQNSDILHARSLHLISSLAILGKRTGLTLISSITTATTVTATTTTHVLSAERRFIRRAMTLRRKTILIMMLTLLGLVLLLYLFFRMILLDGYTSL